MWTHKTAILMTLAAFVLFLATPGLARADEGTGGMETVVNGYHVRLVFPGPAQTGENSFHVQMTGADGSPVSGAGVQVTAQPVEETDTHTAALSNAHAHDPAPPTSVHDGMGGMDMGGTHDAQPAAPPVGGLDEMGDMDSHGTESHTLEPFTVALQAGHEAGEYNGTISFPQAGQWALHMHVMLANGEMFSTEFPLDVASAAPANYGVLAGFFGLNVVIVAVAAVAKKRKAVRA